MGSHRRYNVVHPYTAGFTNQLQNNIETRLRLSKDPKTVLLLGFLWHFTFALIEFSAILIFWITDSFEASWGQNVTVRPGWLDFYTSRQAANALGSLSIILLISFVYGASSTNSLKTYFFSINAFVELVTTMPYFCLWIGSFFDEDLKDVYIPWWLRSWPLLSRVTICVDYAAPKYIQAPLEEVWRLMAAMLTAAGLFHLSENLLGPALPDTYVVKQTISSAIDAAVMSLVNISQMIVEATSTNTSSTNLETGLSLSSALWNISDQQINASEATLYTYQQCENITGTSSTSTAGKLPIQRTISFFESIYFTVTSFGTIGYGDLVPTHLISRLVVSGIIIYALWAFPSFFNKIAELSSALDKSLEYKGVEKGHCHVVISGDLDQDTIAFALDMFCRSGQLVREVDGRTFELVVLSPNEFSQHTQLLVNGQIFDSRVTLLRGDPSDLEDLQRARVSHALAHFYITTHNAAADESDTSTIMQSRKHALAAPHVPQYLTIRRTENASIIKDRLNMMTTMGIWNQQQQHQLRQETLLMGRSNRARKLFSNYFSRENVVSSFLPGGHTSSSSSSSGNPNNNNIDIGSNLLYGNVSSSKNRATLLERDRMLFATIGAACTIPGTVPLLMALASCATRELNGKQLHPWCDQYEWSLENEVMRCACPSVLVGKTFFQIADVFAEFDVTLIGFEVEEEVVDDDDGVTEQNVEKKADFLFGGQSFRPSSGSFSQRKRRNSFGRKKKPNSLSPKKNASSQEDVLSGSFGSARFVSSQYGGFFDTDSSSTENEDEDNNENDSNNSNDELANVDVDDVLSSSGEDDDADFIGVANETKKKARQEKASLKNMQTETQAEAEARFKEQAESAKTGAGFDTSKSQTFLGAGDPHNNKTSSSKRKNSPSPQPRRGVSFNSNVDTVAGGDHYQTATANNNSSSSTNRKVSSYRKRLILNPRGSKAFSDWSTRLVLIGSSGELIINAVQHIEESEDAVLALLEILQRGSTIGKDKRQLVAGFLEKIGARMTVDTKGNFVNADAYSSARLSRQQGQGGGAGGKTSAASASADLPKSHRVHRRLVPASATSTPPMASPAFFGSNNNDENGDDENNDDSMMMNADGNLPSTTSSQQSTQLHHHNTLHRSGDIIKETTALVEHNARKRKMKLLEQQRRGEAPPPSFLNPGMIVRQAAVEDKKKMKHEQLEARDIERTDKLLHGFLNKVTNRSRSMDNSMNNNNTNNGNTTTSTMAAATMAAAAAAASSSSSKPPLATAAAAAEKKKKRERILGFVNFFPKSLPIRDLNKLLSNHILLIDLHSACRQEQISSNGNVLSEQRLIDSQKARARKLFSLIRTVMITNPTSPVVLLARGPLHKTFAELWSSTSFPSNPYHVEGCALDAYDLRSCRPEEAKGVAIFTTHDGQIDEDFDTMAMLVSRSIEMLRRKKAQARAEYDRLVARQRALFELQNAEATATQFALHQRQQRSSLGRSQNNNNNNNNPGGMISLTSPNGSTVAMAGGENNNNNIRRNSHFSTTTSNLSFNERGTTASSTTNNRINITNRNSHHHQLSPSQLALLRSEVPKVTTIIAFTQPDSISLLPPFAKPRSLLDEMAQLSNHYVPSFLAGRVLTSQMIESLLYFNFFSNSLLDVIKCMLSIEDFEGLDEKKKSESNNNNDSSSDSEKTKDTATRIAEEENRMNNKGHSDQPAFGVMAIPDNCTNWRDVRWHLRTQCPGYQAIALYRLVRAIQSDEELAMLKAQQKQRQEEEFERNLRQQQQEANINNNNDGTDSNYDGDSVSNVSSRNQSNFNNNDDEMIDGVKLSTLGKQQLQNALFSAALAATSSKDDSGAGGSNSSSPFGANDDDEDEDDRDDSENVSKFILAAKKSYRYRAKLARQAGLNTADTSSRSERALRQDMRFVYLNPQISTDLVASDLVFFLY